VDRKPGKSVLKVDAEKGGEGEVEIEVEVEGPAMGDISVASPELTKRDMARVSDQQRSAKRSRRDQAGRSGGSCCR
jgi:hypothetical protein